MPNVFFLLDLKKKVILYRHVVLKTTDMKNQDIPSGARRVAPCRKTDRLAHECDEVSSPYSFCESDKKYLK